MGAHRNRRQTATPNGLLYGSGCSRNPSCFTCPLKDCVEAKHSVYYQKQTIPEEALEFQHQVQGLVNDVFDAERPKARSYTVKSVITRGFFSV
jgi:hypothetical protein